MLYRHSLPTLPPPYQCIVLAHIRATVQVLHICPSMGGDTWAFSVNVMSSLFALNPVGHLPGSELVKRTWVLDSTVRVRETKDYLGKITRDDPPTEWATPPGLFEFLNSLRAIQDKSLVKLIIFWLLYSYRGARWFFWEVFPHFSFSPHSRVMIALPLWWCQLQA